jgi:hypothetical protein
MTANLVIFFGLVADVGLLIYLTGTYIIRKRAN